jgi:predicted RNase H-like nuclease
MLARVAAQLAGEPIALATIDMPVATTPIHGRRAADHQISKAFGGRGCSTHTPSELRPGKLGADITRQFSELGFELATLRTLPGTPNRLVEVYPHPALLSLLGRPTRVPYKVGNTKRYWKGKSIPERIALLLSELTSILEGLKQHIDDIPVQIPSPSMIKGFPSLKPIEDALDALICCWVGCEYLCGRARAFGDETSAIWCPDAGEMASPLLDLEPGLLTKPQVATTAQVASTPATSR